MNDRNPPRRQGLLAAAAALLLIAAGGCGSGRYPVKGTVAYPDGRAAKELAGGIVEFEPLAGKQSARGEIREDGTFIMGTDKSGDGVPPGTYVAAVIPLPPELDRPVPPGAIDNRFKDFKTSGLQVTIKPEKNDITLTVEKPKKR